MRMNKPETLEIETELIDKEQCTLRIKKASKEVHTFLLKKLYIPNHSITTISCIELLYITYTSSSKTKMKIKITIGEEEYLFNNFSNLSNFLTSINTSLWSLFEVFLNLKKKGKNTILGPRNSSFLVIDKKSKKPTHYILVLEQNNPIRVSLIKSFIEEALKNKWEPVVAIIDIYGDITFYTPQKLERRKVKEKGDEKSEAKNRS